MKIKMNITYPKSTRGQLGVAKELRALAYDREYDPNFGICLHLDERLGGLDGYTTVGVFFEQLCGAGTWPFKKFTDEVGGWDDRLIWCELMAQAFENGGEFEVTEEQAAMLRNEISRSVIV